MAVRDFVVQTAPLQMDVAEKNLIAQGFTVCFPTVIKTRKSPRYQYFRHQYSEPVFSGYGFISFDRADETWKSINGTRGVKRLICNGDTPIPMPVGALAAIRTAWQEGAFDQNQVLELALKQGQLGQVTTGPFGGFIGECMAVQADRVKLLLDIFGRKTETWLMADAVAAA